MCRTRRWRPVPGGRAAPPLRISAAPLLSRRSLRVSFRVYSLTRIYEVVLYLSTRIYGYRHADQHGRGRRDLQSAGGPNPTADPCVAGGWRSVCLRYPRHLTPAAANGLPPSRVPPPSGSGG